MSNLRSTEYLLMNKDVPWLLFSCQRTEFDEPEFQERSWLTELRPIGYLDLETFLTGRQAPKHRTHIRELLERYGCDDLEGFLRVTYALSLNDTFWVKESGSSIRWDDVSLYRNEFDALVSEAAFDGTISEQELSSTSPEFGTDGFYAKCWVRENGQVFLVKSGSALYEIEPISEFLCSQLAAALRVDHVSYDLAYYHDKLVSKCPLFTSEEVGLAKASAVFRGEQTIPKLLNYYESIGSGDLFRRMCVLDALTLNHDRHYGNFGVLFRTEDMQILRMAPLFDHNRALFPELDEDQLAQPDWYLKNCHPRLGKDFLLTARNLMTDEIRGDLEAITDFRFEDHTGIHIPERRLELLAELVRRQMLEILKK